MKTHRILLVALLALAACSKGDPPPAHAPAPAPAPAPVAQEDEEDELDDHGDAILFTAADSVFERWLEAQNQGDFEAYIALYDPGFEGVRRTADGDAKKLALAAWKADRKKMFGGNMAVAADDVSFDTDMANNRFTFSFTQRFRRGKYEDHGQKVVVIQDEKVVREEMIWSLPGWESGERDPIDATSLTAPITVRLTETSLGENGDCLDYEVRLHVEDGTGATKSVVIGTTTTVFMQDGTDDPAGKVTPVRPAKGKILYRAGGTFCMQLEVSYELKKVGDTIVAIERWEDGESPQGEGTEKRLAVMLPAGAEIATK